MANLEFYDTGPDWALMMPEIEGCLAYPLQLKVTIFDGTPPTTVSEVYSYARSSNKIFEFTTAESGGSGSARTDGSLITEALGLQPNVNATITWFLIHAEQLQDPNVQQFEDDNSPFIAGTVGLPSSGSDFEIADTDVITSNYYNFREIDLRRTIINLS